MSEQLAHRIQTAAVELDVISRDFGGKAKEIAVMLSEVLHEAAFELGRPERLELTRLTALAAEREQEIGRLRAALARVKHGMDRKGSGLPVSDIEYVEIRRDVEAALAARDTKKEVGK